MDFLILGPLEVRRDDTTVPLGGPKQRAVLAHLVLSANRPVTGSRLIDDLWGDDPPDTARNTLQTYLYRLRKILGEAAIEGRPGGYVLHAEPADIDASRFESLVRQGKASLPSDPARAAATFSEALNLWRGPALADLADEPSFRGEIARLEELRLAVTEYRATAELRRGRPSAVIGELERLTSLYPLRERLWVQLMLALYGSGRQAEALATFERARQVLGSELGADPSDELRRLHEQMLRRDPALDRPPSAAPDGHAPAHPADLAPGQDFAGYRVERLLGRGGMSAVYLVEHLRLKRKVALKVLAPELAKDERFRDRFVRESELAASLEDPNVLPIYEAGDEGNVLFIAMRYIDGTDLKTLLEREGPLDLDRTATIVGQVASALDAAHARGLVHRDVKPANILVAPASGPRPEHAYLSDFGLSKRAASDSGLTGTGVFAGTLNYAAPEQFEGAPLDGRTDVYSLGCVLFECLTGELPFRKEQDAALMYAHLDERPPKATSLRPELARGVDQVIEKAMAKRPDERYRGAGELATALRGVSVAEPSAESAPSRRRIRVWLTVAAATVGIGAVTAILSLARGDGTATPPAGTSTDFAAEAPPPSSLVRLDPETATITRTVPDVPGLDPSGPVDPDLEAGEGGIWLYSYDRGGGAFLEERDEETGALVGDRISVSGFTGAGSAIAAGSRTIAYIGAGGPDRVSRLDPSNHEPLRPLTIGGGTSTDLVLGNGTLWVGSTDGTLTGFDALTGRRLAVIDIDAHPDEIAFGAGSVWAMDSLANEIVRVDPVHRRVVDRITVNGNLKDIAAGDGGVWVLDDLAGTVTQIDPETSSARAPVAVGPSPSAIEVGLGSAWVTDAEDGNLYRIDPELGSSSPIHIGAPLATLAVDEATGTLWLGIISASAAA